MKINQCCNGCTKRQVEPINCHSVCPEYAAEQKIVEAEKERIRRNKESEAEVLAVAVVRGDRWRKGAKNKADEKRRKK